MELIKVSDGLPPHYKVVLVNDCDMWHIGHRIVNPDGWSAIETGIMLRNVTHWGYLPEIEDND